MRWLRIKVRARKTSPPQKSRMPPRSRIMQLRQGKQRPKMFLPLNQARRRSFLLQSRPETGVDRIRFLVWQGLSPTHFSALIAKHPVTRRRGVHQAFPPLLLLSFRWYHLRFLFFLFAGTIYASSSFSSPRPSMFSHRRYHPCLLIVGTIHTSSIAARTRLWTYHSYELSLIFLLLLFFFIVSFWNRLA